MAFKAAIVALGLVVAAAPVAQAHGLIGSNLQEVEALLPPDAVAVERSTDGTVVRYRDIQMDGVNWTDVTLHFDTSRHLSSLSLATRDLDYDAMRARAVAQLNGYMREEMKLHTTAGLPMDPVEVQLCQRSDATVVMTLRAETSAL